MPVDLLSEPALERELRGHRGHISCLELSPNGKQIASGSSDNALMIWPLAKKMTAYRFSGHTKPITDLSYNPTGSLVATSSLDCYVRIWSPTPTGKCTMLRPHVRGIRSVRFSPDGNTFATGSDDKVVKLWNTKSLIFARSFVEHTNWVRRVVYSPDGSQLASCSDDKTSKLWDVRKQRSIHTFYEFKGIPNAIQFHPAYDIVGVGLANGSVKLYDLRMYKLLQFYEVFESDVTSIAFDPNGTYMVAGSKHDTKILDLMEGRALYNIGGHAGGVSAVTFSSDGQYFATGGMDCNILLWKANLPREASVDPSGCTTPARSKKKLRASIAPRGERLKNIVPSSPKPSVDVDDEPRPLEVSQPEEEISEALSTPEGSDAGSATDLERKVEMLEADVENLAKTNESMEQQLLDMETKMNVMKDGLERRLDTEVAAMKQAMESRMKLLESKVADL